jgi:hypothetical protein
MISEADMSGAHRVGHAPAKVIAVRTVVWLLVAVAVWDGAGLLVAGEDVASTRTYAALSLVPGGMRTWGALLLAGACALAWGIGRGGAALNRVLSVGVAYYVVWTFVIPGTWVMLGEIPAWPAVSKPAFLAAMYYLCARATAPPPLPPRRHGRRP